MFKIISGVDTEKLLSRKLIILFQPPRAKILVKRVWEPNTKN